MRSWEEKRREGRSIFLIVYDIYLNELFAMSAVESVNFLLNAKSNNLADLIEQFKDKTYSISLSQISLSLKSLSFPSLFHLTSLFLLPLSYLFLLSFPSIFYLFLLSLPSLFLSLSSLFQTSYNIELYLDECNGWVRIGAHCQTDIDKPSTIF